MTREQFSMLAEKASRSALTQPGRYRVKVAAWAALGYAVLFGAIVFSLVAMFAIGRALGEQWFWDAVARDVRLLIVALGFVVAMASILWSVTRSFFLRWPIPAGRRIERADVPQLFAAIDEVVGATKASQPHVVMLTWEFNAAVVQRPRWGWFGRSRDFLLIGLPLAAALSPAEFRALLAHELAHLRGGHCRFSNWIGKVRLTWQHLLGQFAKGRRRAGFVFRRFALWYAPRFEAHSFALARANEFEADRCAAEIAGPEVAAKLLIKIGLLGARLEDEFWTPLNDSAQNTEEPPTGVLQRIISLPAEPSSLDQRHRWLRSVLASETEGTDTHPATIERLRELGINFSTAEEVVAGIESLASEQPSGGTALQQFIGSASAAQILSELENNWRVVVRPSWQKRFQRAEAMRKRLLELEQVLSDGQGSHAGEELSWEQTLLRVELTDSEETRTSLLADFVKAHPSHAVASFRLAERLLAADRAEGVELMERAIQLDTRFSAAGQQLISIFLRRFGQWQQASLRKVEAIRQADVDDAAFEERRRITRKDKFLPHGLDAEKIAALCEQLSKHPRVWRGWLARKAVRHCPEQPWFVLVCALRWRWYENASAVKVQQIVQQLAADLRIDGGTDFIVFAATRRGLLARLTKAIKRTEGSKIYSSAVCGRAWRKELKKPKQPVSFPPPIPAPSLPEVAGQPFNALAAAVFLLIMTAPLAYIGLQLKRGHHLWSAAPHQRAIASRASAAKELDAQRPILVSPDATLSQSDNQLALQWATRVMLTEGFDRHQPDARWKAQARDFIVKALPYWAGIQGASPARTLIPIADNLLAEGCNNPVVLLFAAKLKFETDLQSSEVSPLFEKALRSFAAGSYKAALARLAAEGFILDCERRNEGTGQRGAPTKAWLKAFSQQFADASFTKEEQPVLSKQFCRGIAENLSKDNCDHCLAVLRSAAATTLEDWARLNLIGRLEVQQAWNARGSGYADSVSRAGWRGFFEHLAEARRDLVNSWQLNPARPEAASKMIEVVMGEKDPHSESERLWFDRSITAQFDFAEAYSNLMWAYRPRWNGSLKALMSFGEQCVATNRFDTAVPLNFLYAARSVGQEIEDKQKVFGNPAVGAELVRVFAEYESQKPLPFPRSYLYGLHAYTVYQAGDFTRAYELMRDIEFEVHPELIGEMDPAVSPATFLEQVIARGGPAALATEAGDRALRAGNVDAAVASYEEALHACGNEPHAVHYLRSKLASIHFQRDLASGQWVPLNPAASDGLAGWSTVLGAWRIDADGSLIGRSGSNGMLLVNDSGIGSNFEIRGKIEFLPGSVGEVQAGIAFGFPSWESYDWRSVRLRRNADNRSELVLAQHWQAGPLHPVATTAHNTFLVQSWRGKVTVVMNGQVIFQNENLSAGYVKDPASRVGLGAYAHEGNVFEVRYRDLEVRRITAPPPSDPSSLVATTR